MKEYSVEYKNSELDKSNGDRGHMHRACRALPQTDVKLSDQLPLHDGGESRGGPRPIRTISGRIITFPLFRVTVATYNSEIDIFSVTHL